MIYVVSIIATILVVAVMALIPFFGLLWGGQFALQVAPLGRTGRFLLIMLKSLRRNLLRTSLTYLTTFVLVVVVTVVWSTLAYLNIVTTEKTKNLKVVISEKWQANSQMPFAYAAGLSSGGADASRPGDIRPQDSMTWQFYLATLDPVKRTRENMVIFIALEPSKAATMLDDIFDDLSPEVDKHRRNRKPEDIEHWQGILRQMETNKRAAIVGKERLKAINKQVGERFFVSGLDYAGIDLEFDIVGVFPDGRYNELAIMNRDYLNAALDAYPKGHGGQKHPLADKSLNLVWLQVPDKKTFSQIAEQVESSGLFRAPPVKAQTLSAEMAAVADAYQGLIWGMRWLLSPALLTTMALVLANAISIGVRERRKEIAVLKVLGFRPVQILALVLGEALLIGMISGFLSAALTYWLINDVLADVVGIMIYVPTSAFAWGPGLGAMTALFGSLFPAWSACRVKVSEVFARIE